MREQTSWRLLLTCRRRCLLCFLFTSRRPLPLPLYQLPSLLVVLFSDWTLTLIPLLHPLQVVAAALLLGGHQDVRPCGWNPVPEEQLRVKQVQGLGAVSHAKEGQAGGRHRLL